jgi:hypothetical protein
MNRIFLLISILISSTVYAQSPENSADTSGVNLFPKVEIPKPNDLIPPPVEPVIDSNGFKVGDTDWTNPLDIIEKAITTRNYFYGAAGVLMLLMFIIKKKWDSIPNDIVPYVTLIISSIPALILVLMRPNVDGMMVLKQIGIIWLMTGGAWEAVGKKVIKIFGPKIISIIQEQKKNPEEVVIKKD